MASLNKKAVMGIGTLIIFIATILVAAVAAAVLISTSNVLQQRSLLVGQEARKAITDGIEIVSILTASDAVDETINDFEIMIRLSPGSDALQMRSFSTQYIGPNFDEGAVLTYAENETITQVGAITNAGNSVHDLDGDGTNDTITLVLNAFGASEAIQFNFSDGGASDLISLGVDLSAAGTTAVNVDLAAVGIYNTTGEIYYGIVSIDGSTNTNDQIDAGVNVTIREFPLIADCDFDVIPYETYYCYEVVNGNDDYVLGSGERFKILYRLRDANELTVGEDFGFIFTTEKGRLSEARARTPDVITTTKTKLWPLG